VDHDGDFLPGITIEPKAVHLQLPLIADLVSKNVPVSVPLDAPPSQWGIQDYHVDPPMVRIKGLPDQLQAIYTVSTERFVLPDGTTPVTRECSLIQPPGILLYHLDGKAIESVRVTVNLRKLSSSIRAPGTAVPAVGVVSGGGGSQAP